MRRRRPLSASVRRRKKWRRPGADASGRTAEERRAEGRLRREEERRHGDEDDAIISRLRATENNKFMTDALYTDRALQRGCREQAGAGAAAQEEFVDGRWAGDNAILIDPNTRTQVGDALLDDPAKAAASGCGLRTLSAMVPPSLAAARGREELGFDPSTCARDPWATAGSERHGRCGRAPDTDEEGVCHRRDGAEGFYIVRIFKHGEWHNVVVDDKLLVLNQRG